LINKITTDIGGSGGGHDKACGASIPKDKITKFINTLNSSLAK
jgi:RecJ-like exonuclease